MEEIAREKSIDPSAIDMWFADVPRQARDEGARRTEEQDHPALGQAGNAALGPERPAHRLDLHLRRNLPERRQGGRPDPAQVQHRGDAAASGRNRKGHRARTSRRPHARHARLGAQVLIRENWYYRAVRPEKKLTPRPILLSHVRVPPPHAAMTPFSVMRRQTRL